MKSYALSGFLNMSRKTLGPYEPNYRKESRKM